MDRTLSTGYTGSNMKHDLQSPTDEDLAFRFTAGAPSLDLVATLGERGHRDIERIGNQDRLKDWIAKAGYRLRPDEVDAAGYDEAITLREAIHSLATALIEGVDAPAGSIRKINQCAVQPPLVTRLRADGETREWADDGCFPALLATLARDAIDLFGGEMASRVKRCAEPTCNMLFLDRSRPGTRKWCSMTGRGCGNRAKKAAFRERQRARASN